MVAPGTGRALAAAIEESRSHGLDPRDYHAATVRRLASGATPGLDEADRELLLTDALVRLAYHLHFGKANPRELYPGWNFTRSLGAIDPVVALEAIVASPALGEALERYAPRLPAYRRLREALARYRAIEASGGWPQIGPGTTLEPGMSDPRVAALRERLTVSGDIERGAGEPARFDPALETAVRRFQSRHGLEVDGIVGRRTLAALNVGVPRRIGQIRVNLERVRWVAQDLAGDYLIVDIAGFSARLVLDGRLVVVLAGGGRPPVPPDTRVSRHAGTSRAQPDLDRAADDPPGGPAAEARTGPRLPRAPPHAGRGRERPAGEGLGDRLAALSTPAASPISSCRRPATTTRSGS